MEELDTVNWLTKGEKSKKFIQQITEKLQEIEEEYEEEVEKIIQKTYGIDSKGKASKDK